MGRHGASLVFEHDYQSAGQLNWTTPDRIARHSGKRTYKAEVAGARPAAPTVQPVRTCGVPLTAVVRIPCRSRALRKTAAERLHAESGRPGPGLPLSFPIALPPRPCKWAESLVSAVC